MPDFISVHAELLQEYIAYKRSLGYKFQYDYSMAQFDHFLYENNYQSICLSRDICSKWEEKRSNETDANRYQRVGLIHNYALYLQKIGFKTHIPEHQYRFKSTFTPYIFTHQELELFFEACDVSIGNASPAFPAIFRVIYGCGLRKEEALEIRIQDINFEEKILYIRNSKNRQERALPLSKSVADTVFNYYREYRTDAMPADYLFVTKYKGRIQGNTLYHYFRIVLERAGISHGGRGKGPRIHDLRHTFSVHALAKIAEQSIDLYCFLPILSKYLGHKSILATEGYVQLTAELYPKMMDDINKTCAYIYPEVQ